MSVLFVLLAGLLVVAVLTAYLLHRQRRTKGLDADGGTPAANATRARSRAWQYFDDPHGRSGA